MGDDKPPLREVRRANHLADVLTAARLAGIDDAGLMDAIRRRLLDPIGREKERRMATTNAVARRGAEGAAPTPIPDSIMEHVVATGDLKQLSIRERMAYYAERCRRADLDPATGPFQYITLQGKLQLYATKEATNQLIAKRGLSVRILERKLNKELQIFSVRCLVRTPQGAEIEDCADVSVAGLQGDPLSNMFMKAVTKATRRTVLKACGLGELDELEVETIPGALKSVADLPPSPPAARPAEKPRAAPPDADGGDEAADDAGLWPEGKE